jgi:4-hydroxy-3-methylbut-2-enyl diphosphate reductase IspH
MKEIIRADYSGFCFGVKAAIEKAEKAELFPTANGSNVKIRTL